MKENKITLNTKFDLFEKMINDFRNYKTRPDEIEIMFSIPPNMKKVLREVANSDYFSELLIKNETEKTEKRRKQEKKRNAIKRTLTKEEEAFQSKERLLNNKRALNTSCFGQRTIATLNQFFNSVSETINLNENICDSIFNIDKEAFYTYVDILKGNIQKETTFVFLNRDSLFYDEMKKLLLDKSKNNKKNNNEGELKNLIMMGDKTFYSLDEYYKFIKKEIEEDKDNKYSQYGLFMKSMELKNKIIKTHKNNFPLLKSPTPIRNQKLVPQIQKAYENLCGLPNIGILNIMNRNKNIKKELYDRKVNQGLIKNKNKLMLSDYDYGSILDIYTKKKERHEYNNNNNNKTQINSTFHNYYNTQLFHK